MRSLHIVLVIFATSMTQAVAQPAVPRLSESYVAISGGVVEAPDVSYLNGLVGVVNVEFDAGYGVDVAVGRTFGPLRAELIGFYEINEANNVVALGIPLGATGDIQTMGAMVGGYYHLPGLVISPYLGGAIGFGQTQFDVQSLGAPILDSSVSSVVGRAVVGVSYDFPVAPVSVFAEARYRHNGTFESNSGGITDEVEINSFAYAGGLRLSY